MLAINSYIFLQFSKAFVIWVPDLVYVPIRINKMMVSVW